MQLHPAAISQSVTVTPEAAISSRHSGLETRFGADYIRTIPSRRFSMFDLIKSTPGVSPTSPSSGTVNTISVFGSAVNENTFLIDGTNFTALTDPQGNALVLSTGNMLDTVEAAVPYIKPVIGAAVTPGAILLSAVK